MIALDPLTVLLFSALVVVVTSALFLADAWGPDLSLAERLWCTAFASSLLACVLLAPVELLPEARTPLVLIANCLLVLAPSTAWNGLRAHAGRRAMLPVTAGLVALTAIAAVVEPHDYPWEGMIGYLSAMILALSLLVWEAVRDDRGHLRTVIAFAVIMGLLAAYYVMRLVVFVSLGPDSDFFATYASTQVTGILASLGVLVTALALIVLRHDHQHAARAGSRNFDPMTGARTTASFTARAGDLLRDLAADGTPLSLVVFEPESDREIAAAFGREDADRALVAIGETVISLLPTGAIVGRDGAAGRSFEVLLPGSVADEAAQWAEAVRVAILSGVFETDSTPLRLPVALGISSTQRQGYGLATLQAAAHEAAAVAIAARETRAGSI